MERKPLGEKVHNVGERHIRGKQKEQYNVRNRYRFHICHRAEGNQAMHILSGSTKITVTNDPGEDSGKKNSQDEEQVEIVLTFCVRPQVIIGAPSY